MSPSELTQQSADARPVRGSTRARQLRRAAEELVQARALVPDGGRLEPLPLLDRSLRGERVHARRARRRPLGARLEVALDPVAQMPVAAHRHHAEVGVEREVDRACRGSRRRARARRSASPARRAPAAARPMPRPACSGETHSSVSSSIAAEARRAGVARPARRRPRRSRTRRPAARPRTRGRGARSPSGRRASRRAPLVGAEEAAVRREASQAHSPRSNTARRSAGPPSRKVSSVTRRPRRTRRRVARPSGPGASAPACAAGRARARPRRHGSPPWRSPPRPP